MGKKQEKKKHCKTVYLMVLIQVISMLALTGCNDINGTVDTVNDMTDQGITVSNDMVIPEGAFMINAAGYEPEGSKMAILTDNSSQDSFKVIDAETGETVFTDSIRYRKETGSCDFSDLVKEGTYYILTDSGIRSEEFTVSRDIYRQILAGRISRFGEDDGITGNDDFSSRCLKITDLLLMQEFFPSAIDREALDDPMVIPRTVLLAKAQTEELKNTRFSSDPGVNYQYSAIMALFSYEYERFDKKYASECRDLSSEAYDKAEKEYEKESVGEKKAIDDKRYWASAQLYKLTGENRYRVAAEGYAKNPPGGFRRDANGYLGTIAYLTCYKRIDLNVGELLITSLMDEINDAVRESFKEEYLTAVKGEPDDKDIETIYENARLMVLGNYIFKNIRYIEASENQVAYLYGRNPLGKDYAYDTGSEYYNEPMEFILAGLIDSYIYEDKKPEAMKRQ